MPSADTCRAEAVGRCPGGPAGAHTSAAGSVLGWLGIPAMAPVGAFWEAGGGRARRSWYSSSASMYKHLREYFRIVRARKTNPGNADKEQMLTFMSHPETTCSSSHLQACSSIGRCRIVVFRKPN